MSRRLRREYPRRRRHRRHLSGRRSPLVWLGLTGFLLLFGSWIWVVLKFTRGLDAGQNQPYGSVGPSKGWWNEQMVLSPVAGSASEPLHDQKPPNRSASGTEKPLVLHSVFGNVDYRGGDIQGPVDAKNPEECRSLCVSNGRCLKWTLQEREGICWLKGEGSTRIEDVAGVTSGIVRTEEDKTIPEATEDDRSHPPLVCCPDGAAEPPLGVHALDLWDDEPGSDWTTSFLLGNGHLGAMLGMGTFQENIFLSDGSLWAGKGKVAEKTATASSFPRSPDRYEEFQKAREALLEGDIVTAQERAGRMPTSPDGFVGSFEYAGELHLQFGGGSAGDQKAGEQKGRVVDGYIRHLHLNNGTAEVMFSSTDYSATAAHGDAVNTAPEQQYHDHHREAFASNVDGVLAMRLSCKDREGGRGCLSLSVTPKREGDALSHVTEAWQLPPPQARQRDNAAAAAADHPGEGKDSWDHLASGGGAGGAYVGLFRPPGGGGKVSEMGFHMCVAVVSLGEGEWSGAVAEEYSEQLSPSQGRRSEEARTQRREDDLERARLEDRPDVPPRRKLSQMRQIPPPKVITRHRVALSPDEEHGEAMVLLSVVTEGEPDTNDEKERRKLNPHRAFGDAGSTHKGGENDPRDWGGGDKGFFGQREAGWETGRIVDAVDAVQETEMSGARKAKPTAAGAKLKDSAEAGEEKEDSRMRRRCLERLEAAAALGFQDLRRRHADDFRALSERVHFSLGPSSGDNGPGAEASSPREAGAVASAGLRNERADAGSRRDRSESVESRSSESCVAGLPIRTRVSRSGKACIEEGEGEGMGSGGDGGSDRTVVDDGLIELMYHYGRYLIISGSRPGGRPLNLQGIWANSLKAKWEGDYHMNINLQMNYWGAHAAGLSECAAPLVRFVEDLSDSGRQTAHSYYRAAGWVSHANTDRWGGTAAHGDAVWALCPTCGAWMALHLWEAFEYTRDASLLLSSVVPVLEGAVAFFLDYMVLADDGLGDGMCLLTGPSTSPENSLPAVKNVLKNGLPPVQAEEKNDAPPKAKGQKIPPKKKAPPDLLFPFVAMSPAIDVAIVRQLFENFIDASREVVPRLALLEQGGSPSLSGLPADWTTEHASRLFNPPGLWREEENEGKVSPDSTDRGTFPQTFSAVSERLRRISDRSEEALSRLPNGGRPSIGRDGMVREYRGADTSGLPDPGHRHFSGLWALYPGFQLSPDEGEDEFEAAAATVKYKVENGGGHTSWSRAWLANLRARLFQGSEALESLRGVLRDQCIGSLFSLHPPLTRTPGKEMAECTSCFEFRAEESRPSRKNKQPRPIESGLVTRDGSVFQIDGNLGVLAGVNEMLLQSRYRYSRREIVEVRLLPSLPEDWQQGRFRGLIVKGGYEVDVEWNRGEISTASLRPLTNNVEVVGEDQRGDRIGGKSVEAKPRHLKVLSRTQLIAVLVVDGKKMASDARLLDEEEMFFEGGVYWFCVSVKALRHGEEVRFYSVSG